jgi:hypothetical protein
MRFTISDLVEQLRIKHAQMMLRGATPRAVEMATRLEPPAKKQPAQIVPHQPVSDHRLRASQM